MGWLEDVLRILVPSIGAGIVLGQFMVLGLRAHKALDRHAPGLSRGIPPDVFIAAGLAVAALSIIIGWVR